MFCNDFSPAELTKKLPNGYTIAYYVTECEAYGERASIPQPDKCNDLPACPFALQEMKKNRIAYAFGNFKDGFTDEHVEKIREFSNNPNKATLFYICFDIDEVSFDEGVKLSDDFAAKVVEKHPEFLDPDREMTIIFANPKESKDYAYVNHPPFCFFLIQRSKELSLAAQQLKKMGYYDKLNKDELVMDNQRYHERGDEEVTTK